MTACCVFKFEQYTMKFDDNSKQDVTSDPNENVVQYHVSNPSHDAWVVNDFNRVLTDFMCFLAFQARLSFPFLRI